MNDDMADDAPTPPEREAFLVERRRVARARFDQLFAPTYDQTWAEISPSHAEMLGRFLDRVAPGGVVLDAACGTGKYWPLIVASGRRVEGIDQSQGMLAQAAQKAPDVSTRCLALQELDDHEAFDGVLCIDGLEYIGPEEWPPVVRRLREAARPGAPVYLTVELFDIDDPEARGMTLDEALATARARGEPVVAGEDLTEDGGYHFFPGPKQALAWVARAALAVDETYIGDSYLHVLAHRSR
jgi:SAM-dependent methyltransferase